MHTPKSKKFNRTLAFILSFILLFQQTGLAQAVPELNIAGHIAALRQALTADKFRPLHLRYLSYNPAENSFHLFLDKGDELKEVNRRTGEQANRQTKELLNYFFIGVSLPNDTFWVNLRPDSPDNVIDPLLAQTDVGKILLEADLQLKKDTALATSPDTPEGKEYWDKLYKKAGELLGSENITIPTLTRPWIVPDEIIIREADDNAYIYKATLKVMLEEDYLKDGKGRSLIAPYKFDDPRLKTLNEYSSQLIRELIIPKLAKEINSAKRYAPLRQVYYSLILAQWFKRKFYGKSGLYAWLIDQKNLNGLTSKQDWSKAAYFQAYQKSFKDGEYNFKVPVSTPFGQMIRSYFSGGMAFTGEAVAAATNAGIRLAEPNKPLSSALMKQAPQFLTQGGNLQDLAPQKITSSPAPGIGGMGLRLEQAIAQAEQQRQGLMGQCVTADTLLVLNGGQQVPIVQVKAGDYVLSLNETNKEIEPHRINGLLDMGIKPVFRLTTASGRSIKTTANHPYLTKHGWVKVSNLKTGGEIGVPEDKGSPAIRPVADFNALNKNSPFCSVKRGAVFPDAEAMGAWRQVYQRLGADKRVAQGGVILQFFKNALLDFFRQGFKIALSARSKLDNMHKRTYAKPSSRWIFSKGTQPFFLASAIDFCSETTKSGLRGSLDSILSINHPAGFMDLSWYSCVDNLSTRASSILESTSKRANVSKIKSWGTPFLSTIAPALESLSSLNTDAGAILLKGISFANFTFAGNNFIIININTYGLLLSRPLLFWPAIAEASQIDDGLSGCDIRWDRIISIEPAGVEHVYDIEVEGTHNFIANGIFAHNTYIREGPAPGMGGVGFNNVEWEKKLEKLDSFGRFDLTDGELESLVAGLINSANGELIKKIIERLKTDEVKRFASIAEAYQRLGPDNQYVRVLTAIIEEIEEKRLGDNVNPFVSAQDLINHFNNKVIRSTDGKEYSLTAYSSGRQGAWVYLKNASGKISDTPVLRFSVSPNEVSIVIALDEVDFGNNISQSLTGKGLGGQIYGILGEALPPGAVVEEIIGNAVTRRQIFSDYAIAETADGGRCVITKQGGRRVVDASAATEEEISLQDVIAKTLMGHLCVKAGLSNFEIYCYRSDSQANGIEALIKLLEGAQKDNSNMIDIFRLRAVKLPSLDTDSNVGGSGQGPGGIDFRAMPMAVQPDSVGRLAGVPVSRLNGPHINLDIELREIQRMIRAGIIPSLERIKECLVASCQGKDCRQKREKILACLADILRMEEERAVDTESQMKEVLVLLESDKPAVELEAALSKIVVMPGEPKGAE